MSWVMTLFVYVILLCASTIHQVTGGNKTNVPTRADDNCVCYDMDGKAVNPTPLQSKDGSPRYLQHILASRDLPFTCTFAYFTPSRLKASHRHRETPFKPRWSPDANANCVNSFHSCEVHSSFHFHSDVWFILYTSFSQTQLSVFTQVSDRTSNCDLKKPPKCL